MSHLTLEQRCEIQTYRKAGKKQTEIAELAGRAPLVICRGLKRNKLKRGGYSASKTTESLQRS